MTDYRDAYKGAREDLLIWKRRALEAEELVRKFMADVNGPVFMGEPVQHAATGAPSQDREDALRYRWLRDVRDAKWRPFGIRAGYSAEQANAAIDAAIATRQAPKEPT